VKGDSAGQAPSQVKRKKLETNLQKTKRARGENITPLKSSFLDLTLKRKRERTESNKPTTPPTLLGIERKIA
jgi:hypothetical protein